jgi:pantoate--beta-alanine ligase
MQPPAQFEIEQKYAHADFDGVEQRLARFQAGPPEVEHEADHYFNAPDRDFVQTSEAFRLRRVGERNLLTYKGPRQAGPMKTRPELEIPLLPGEEAARQMQTLLEYLGFRFVTVVRKTRRSFPLAYQGWRLTLCLDEVEELGRFVELEILAPPEQATEAQAVLGSLAGELGLTEVQPRSYLGLLLAARATRGERGASTPWSGRASGQGVDTPRSPVIARTVAELHQALREARRQRHTIGLVPTMGALHRGHRALIEASRARDSFVVVSIFVNPTQFGPHEDLARYPRPFDDDVALCAEAGVDLIFQPSSEEVYPASFRTFVEVTGLQDVLEGASRPGHFRGVCTVVLKLFNLVQPGRAYFGQKDAQQVRIIRQMVEDLHVPVEVVVLPTVREPDGLALSSRNRYLDPEQRRQATALVRSLERARDAYQAGERDARVLQRILTEQIAATPGARLDQAAVVDPDTLASLDRVGPAALLTLAVRFGDTRLIDNLLLTRSG